MSTPTAWNISDVAHISFIESVAWSPDGANLAYVIANPDSMANKYRRSIWLRRGNAARADLVRAQQVIVLPCGVLTGNGWPLYRIVVVMRKYM